MGKMGKIYPQRFRDEWLEDSRYKEWLQKLDEDDTRCICTYCLSILCAKISDIEKHRNTAKHKKGEMGLPISNKRQLEFPIKLEEKLQTSKMKRDPLDTAFEDTSLNDSDNSPETDQCGITNDTSMISPSLKKRRRYIASTLKPSTILRPQPKEEETNEIDAFAKSIAAQMKVLPERHVLDLFSELQNVVTQRRQLVLEENEKRRGADRQSFVPSSQVITVHMPSAGQSVPSSQTMIYNSKYETDLST